MNTYMVWGKSSMKSRGANSSSGEEELQRVHSRRYSRLAVGLLVVLLTVGVAFWAGRVTLGSQEAADQVPPEESTVEVIEQELGRVLTLTTTMTRPTSQLAQNFLTGVITFVAGDGEYHQGDTLYSVNDTDVILVEGDVPFWRDLAPGVDGEDVRQLQQMLSDLGFDVDVNGSWDATTSDAVHEWQRDRGKEETSSLLLGELVSAPSLPVSMTFDPQQSALGAQVTGGETLLHAATGAPEFFMEVSAGQAEMIPSGTTVTILHDDQQWDGVTGGSEVGEDGLVTIDITGSDGGLVCNETCDQLPMGETNHLMTDVEIVPAVSGPAIPVSAVNTGSGGVTTVEVATEDAVEEREIEVLSIADGLAAVDGVEPGEKVRVHGEQPSPPTPSPYQSPPESEQGEGALGSHPEGAAQ